MIVLKAFILHDQVSESRSIDRPWPCVEHLILQSQAQTSFPEICCSHVTVQLDCCCHLSVLFPVPPRRPLHSFFKTSFMSLMLWIVFVEVLGALVSIIFIWIVTGVLVYMAIERLIDNSYDIDASIMLITAAVGLAFNILWVPGAVCWSCIVYLHIFVGGWANLGFFYKFSWSGIWLQSGTRLRDFKIFRKKFTWASVQGWFMKPCSTVATSLYLYWMKCRLPQKILIYLFCNLARISLYSVCIDDSLLTLNLTWSFAHINCFSSLL